MTDQPDRHYKFVVERDTNLVVPRYSYTIYRRDGDDGEWIPVIGELNTMKLSKKKVIEMARAEIREMQAIDKSTKIVHEEEVK